MVYITGDTHGCFERFDEAAFPAQRSLTKADCVIVAGDFGGVWRGADDDRERRLLDALDEKPFTLLWVDGNHENFDRLSGDEFETVDFCGGRAQRIRNSIYRLLRGEVYQIEGRRVFTFGGATSQDIRDGILDPADYDSRADFEAQYCLWRDGGRQFRVRGVSWWPGELPNEAEMRGGMAALEAVHWSVDYVITHCLPHDVAAVLSHCTFQPDRLTLYFNELIHRGLSFDRWYCGHYHTDRTVMGRFRVLWQDVVPMFDR